MKKCETKQFRPLVILGPSGAGKGTLIKKLIERYPEHFSFSVSYTTRNKRVEEINGIDYNFVSNDVFQKMTSEGAFIEYGMIHGNMYGTTKIQIC